MRTCAQEVVWEEVAAGGRSTMLGSPSTPSWTAEEVSCQVRGRPSCTHVHAWVRACTYMEAPGAGWVFPQSLWTLFSETGLSLNPELTNWLKWPVSPKDSRNLFSPVVGL